MPDDELDALYDHLTAEDRKAMDDARAELAGMTAEDIAALVQHIVLTLPGEAPYTCKYCGAPSRVDPADQYPPADVCHEVDHGYGGCGALD